MRLASVKFAHQTVVYFVNILWHKLLCKHYIVYNSLLFYHHLQNMYSVFWTKTYISLQIVSLTLHKIANIKR